jgi:hypothetical protein
MSTAVLCYNPHLFVVKYILWTSIMATIFLAKMPLAQSKGVKAAASGLPIQSLLRQTNQCYTVAAVGQD